MDIRAMKEKWTGWEFDQLEFTMDAERMKEFAIACGEKQPRFVDPADPDFQAVPTYTTQFHGRRQLPEGFPMDFRRSFDGGKCVEPKGAIRAGDRITASSTIHDIYEKSGRSGGMMFVIHRMTFTNQDGELASIVDWTMIQKLG